MFKFASRRDSGPAGARGWRAYGVGDIHGRLDLLDALLDKIHADIERSKARKVRTVFLLGNHEEVLLRILRGEAGLISKWQLFGGSECLKSYNVDPDLVRRMRDEDAVETIRAAVPREHVKFLESFDDSCRFGDYLFVHAGIRPGVEFDQQRQADLRWIREPFLFDETDHGFVVVHGHTIRPEVEIRKNRIGIDTGAYRSGVLSALAVEGSDRWLIDTRLAGNDVNLV
jgi:serine/threonine protein phosphatase 1